MTDIPPGIWYDAPRKRWRVRLYRQASIVWLSYHATQPEALEAYSHALSVQENWLAPIEKPIVRPRIPQTILELFL